jgi:DNA-3-methyladenine glycosylase
VLEVARASIGKHLVHRSNEGLAIARIVETEAYRGPEDRAAHSRGGRRTARTEVMYGPAGHAYLFFVYGMHWQLNLVTGRLEEPHAVLIRAVEPVAGVELMAKRRGMSAERRELTNGPGKLCQALGIDGSAYGRDLTTGSLALYDGPPATVRRSPRVGIDYAGRVWASKPWRFCDADSAYVSRPPRPGATRPSKDLARVRPFA